MNITPEITFKVYPIKTGHYLVSYIDPITRKRVRNRFQTLTEAKKCEQELIYKFSNEGLSSQAELTIKDLTLLYQQEIPNNKLNFRWKTFHDFLDTFGDFKPNQVTPEAMEIFLEQLHKENNYTLSTIASRAGIIKRFFKYLEDKNIIKLSPAAHIKYKRPRPLYLEERIILTDEQMRNLLSEMKEKTPGHLYPIATLLYETAARTVEIVDLMWNDIDFKKNKIIIRGRRNLKTRELKISDEACELLKQQPKTSAYVFTNHKGYKMNRNYFYALMRQFKTTSSFREHWHLKCFRTSIAVNWLEDGGSMKELSVTLGHSGTNYLKNFYREAIKNNKVSSL